MTDYRYLLTACSESSVTYCEPSSTPLLSVLNTRQNRRTAISKLPTTTNATYRYSRQTRPQLPLLQPFDAHCYLMGTTTKHVVPFVIFDIRALWTERQSARMSKNYKWRLIPAWHRMLY